MTPSRSQLEGYDAQPLLDMAEGLTSLGPKLEGLFNRYVTTVTARDWQGLTAEATHNRAVSDRNTAVSMVDTLEKAASKLRQGYWDVRTPLNQARDNIMGAEGAGFSVSEFLTVSHPAGSDPTAETEAARAEWESQILAAANAVESADKQLQQELVTIGASMKAEFEAVGRSQTNTSETHYADAERFLYDELMKNKDSDTVRAIQNLLREPKWWEIALGRDYGSDVTAALAMWAAKVAPGQDWDYKPVLTQRYGLKTADDFYFQQPGTDRQVLWDIYGNLNYGYVGRAAGIDRDTLIKGGSLGETILTGTDDAGDQITMKAGMDLYDKYGAGLSEEQFHQEVIAVIDQLEAAKAEGKNVPQVRHAN
jgi:Bacterial toxin 44